jgi:hypothetical protein
VFTINNNRGSCNAGTDSWIEHTLAAGFYGDMTVAVDFLPRVAGSSLIYVGFAIGLQPSWESIFIKLQDNNGDGNYDRLFFEPAINAGGGWTAGYVHNLAVPTPSGRMSAYFTGGGDVANLDIDRNFDGVVDEHFQVPGILAANLNLGSRVAICCYGAPAFDNFVCTDGSTPAPSVYCTAGTTTHGCVPSMSFSGTASASATSGFVLACSQVEGVQNGLFFYGTNGPVAVPWAAGSTSLLCVKIPLQRLAAQNAGGTIGLCDGAFSADFLAFMAANPSALGQPMNAGQQYRAQAWFRDPPAPKTTNLSDALLFTLAP